jgi:hypothetical protein
VVGPFTVGDGVGLTVSVTEPLIIVGTPEHAPLVAVAWTVNVYVPVEVILPPVPIVIGRLIELPVPATAEPIGVEPSITW